MAGRDRKRSPRRSDCGTTHDTPRIGNLDYSTVIPIQIILPLCVAMLCIVTWRFYPSFGCTAVACGCFVAVLPFCESLFDGLPHGHPDIRGAIFQFLVAPLFLAGAIVSGVGLCLRGQHRGACAAALLLNVCALIYGFTHMPPSLSGL